MRPQCRAGAYIAYIYAIKCAERGQIARAPRIKIYKIFPEKTITK